MRVLSFVLAIIAMVFLLSIKPYEACRMLDGEEKEWFKNKKMVFQSLQSQPGPDPCTYIPTPSGPSCKIKQKNFARHITSPPPPPPRAYPKFMVPGGVATNRK